MVLKKSGPEEDDLTVQNLNAKLSPRPRPKTAARVAAANRHRRALFPPRGPARAAAAATRGGGYLIDV